MGRILGIDYGKTRIGLALSDPLHIIASPFKTIQFHDIEQTLSEIVELIDRKEVELIVVGKPISLSGKTTEMTKNTTYFVEKLKGKINIPLQEIDERLSSVEAIKSLHKKGVKIGHNKAKIDSTAAAIILQRFLDGAKP